MLAALLDVWEGCFCCLDLLLLMRDSLVRYGPATFHLGFQELRNRSAPTLVFASNTTQANGNFFGHVALGNIRVIDAFCPEGVNFLASHVPSLAALICEPK